MSSLIENDKYINPLTDFGFKKLFGTEMNKDLLIDFLNEILPKNKKVQDLAYSSTDKPGATKKDRKAIFDLYCTSPEGDKFIVEMQKAKQTYFKDRSLFYSTFPIQEQAEKGDWNFKLSPVYSIGILDFEFEEEPSGEENISLHHIIELKNQKGEVFYDKLKFVYLELPKFTKEVEELKTRYEKWLYVLRHLSDLQERPNALQERVFTKLFQAAEIANFSKEEKDAYEESLKHYRDIKNVVDSSKEEGRLEGIEEGKEEESDENIKNGIMKGYSNEIISDITGRNIENIQRIREEMNNNQ
jgi:predicted transposase/invertase (TIGR01784 family)